MAALVSSRLLHLTSARASRLAMSSMGLRAFSTTLTSRNTFTFNIQDQADFTERVLKSDKPVLVDFHADWCGPCKLLGPRIEKAVASREGKVILAKVNVDDLDEIAAEYNIRSLPTVMAMKNGNETERFIGLQEDDIIDTFVEKALN